MRSPGVAPRRRVAASARSPHGSDADDRPAVRSLAPASSQEEVRRHNLATLLRLIHVNGASSRAALTASTGLNRSTVKALVTELVQLELVRESVPAGTGSAGRPSIVVQPASERVFAVAVDVGAEHLTAARIGLGGVVLDRRDVRLARGSQSVVQTVRRTARLVTTLIDGATIGSRCVGVGVSVSGLVSAVGGAVRLAPNLGWKDVPFGELLADRIGSSLPVAVGNDADLGAMAEHTRGAAAGLADLVYLSGEVGLGGGIILGGKPLAGAGGYAGEVGHMVVRPRGAACRCGSRGCWETEVGEEAILRATKSAPGTSLAEVRTAFEQGDRSTRAGIEQIGHWLGIGVANLVNILNPQVVILGGATREIYAAAEPFAQETLRTALAAPREQVRLVLAALGNDSALVGAAELAFVPVLDNPVERATTASVAGTTSGT